VAARNEKNLRVWLKKICGLLQVRVDTLVNVSRKGFPDRVIWFHTHPLFVELKAENGRVAKEQTFYHKELIDNGYKFFLLYNTPESKQEFLRFIRTEYGKTVVETKTVSGGGRKIYIK
jgi:hypothetical protein